MRRRTIESASVLGFAMIVVGLSTAAQAAIVSVNLLGDNPTGGVAQVTGSYGVAAEGSVVGNWNNVLAGASDGSSVSNVLDSDGVASTVDVVAADVVANGSFANIYNFTPMKAGLTDGTGALATVLTINDINGFASKYDLIVHLAGNVTVRGSIGNGTTTYYYSYGPNPASTTLVEVTDTTPGDGLDEGNYVVFRGLTANSVTLTNDANNTLYGGAGGATGFGGFQIVPVPEPATLTLLALSGLLIGARSRRG